MLIYTAKDERTVALSLLNLGARTWNWKIFFLPCKVSTPIGRRCVNNLQLMRPFVFRRNFTLLANAIVSSGRYLLPCSCVDSHEIKIVAGQSRRRSKSVENQFWRAANMYGDLLRSSFHFY